MQVVLNNQSVSIEEFGRQLGELTGNPFVGVWGRGPFAVFEFRDRAGHNFPFGVPLEQFDVPAHDDLLQSCRQLLEDVP